MMNRMLLFFILTFSLQSFSQKQHCGKGSIGLFESYSWCAEVPAKSNTSTVLYYFHGNGGSEKDWQNSTREALYKKWQTSSQGGPIIISLSFGKFWFLTKEKSNLFIEKVRPAIEKRLNLKPSTRLLMGESMGGYNAFFVATQAPTSFQKFAVLCPALYPVNPFVNSETESFVQKQPAWVNQKFVNKWLTRQKEVYQSEPLWSAVNPLKNLQRLEKHQTQIYLLADEKDSLGFYEATVKLATELKKLAEHTGLLHLIWFSIPGANHCQTTAESQEALADFLN
jgi:hypothetical protein